jgi:uncharacterized protein YlaI
MQIQAVCCFMIIRTKSAITYQYRNRPIARRTLPFMYSCLYCMHHIEMKRVQTHF